MENLFLREYPLSKEQVDELCVRMKRLTGITTLAEYDMRALVICNEDKQFTSIIFNSYNYNDVNTLVKIYNLVFDEDDLDFTRTRFYLKMRKRFRLQTDETLVTILSYMQASGITDELILLNRALKYVERGMEY